MSASERLRELGKGLPRERIEERIRSEGWNPDLSTPQKLEEVSRQIRLDAYDAALTLIADVVEAAEKELHHPLPFTRAEDALYDALTALREALEEK